MTNINASQGFLRGNKKAITTFLVTVILSGLLLLSGIIFPFISDTTKEIHAYETVYLSSGENKFKYSTTTTGSQYLYLYSYNGVDSIKITDSKGNNIYSDYSVSSSRHNFYVYNVGPIYITITLYNGSSNSFYISN